MENTESLLRKLIEKLDKEYDSYVEKVITENPREIVSKSYELAIKQCYIDMFDGDLSLDRTTINSLLNKDNLLDYLYNDWMHSDSNINTYLKEISGDYLEEIKDNYIEHTLESNDIDFIEDVSIVLKSLDNSEFCYHLKDKYELDNYDEFDPIIVKEIMDSKDGISYLKDFFKEVKDNEQLLYLVENYTFDNNEHDKISDVIIPKLEELDKENQKINDTKSKKSKDDMER